MCTVQLVAEGFFSPTDKKPPPTINYVMGIGVFSSLWSSPAPVSRAHEMQRALTANDVDTYIWHYDESVEPEVHHARQLLQRGHVAFACTFASRRGRHCEMLFWSSVFELIQSDADAQALQFYSVLDTGWFMDELFRHRNVFVTRQFLGLAVQAFPDALLQLTEYVVTSRDFSKVEFLLDAQPDAARWRHHFAPPRVFNLDQESKMSLPMAQFVGQLLTDDRLRLHDHEDHEDHKDHQDHEDQDDEDDDHDDHDEESAETKRSPFSVHLQPWVALLKHLVSANEATFLQVLKLYPSAGLALPRVFLQAASMKSTSTDTLNILLTLPDVTNNARLGLYAVLVADESLAPRLLTHFTPRFQLHLSVEELCDTVLQGLLDPLLRSREAVLVHLVNVALTMGGRAALQNQNHAIVRAACLRQYRFLGSLLYGMQDDQDGDAGGIPSPVPFLSALFRPWCASFEDFVTLQKVARGSCAPPVFTGFTLSPVVLAYMAGSGWLDSFSTTYLSSAEHSCFLQCLEDWSWTTPHVPKAALEDLRWETWRRVIGGRPYGQSMGMTMSMAYPAIHYRSF